MLVLDENLPAGQQQLLRRWRIRFRVIGEEIGFSGTTDENLVPVLHRLTQATFFSLDRNFYRPDRAHSRYCLVWLNVRGRLGAEYIRRFLRHSEFDTHGKRAGKVVRVHPDGVVYWQIRKSSPTSIGWKSK